VLFFNNPQQLLNQPKLREKSALVETGEENDSPRHKIVRSVEQSHKPISIDLNLILLRTCS
jgi:hypothetical protein